MMLCVISYWVLSGAKRRQIQQLRCCVLPAKLLKRRDVYLKLTRHNGRAGAHGTYNPKHNDRSFNLANSEHIDQERAKGNIYWDCYHGIRSTSDKDKQTAAFSDVEKMFYEIHYSHFVENQNARNAKIRHTERNRTIEDLLAGKKTCPEETIYQFGTLDEHASVEDLVLVVTEFIAEFHERFGAHVHLLDWALHLDESTPHIHERHVFDCENKYGELAPQQEKALEALGFDLPDPNKSLSRRNNRKITFDAACRKMLFEIAKRHGLDLEEEAEYGNRKYLEKQDFILAKQKEQLAAQQNRLDELTLKVSDMETLLEDVSAAACDKAVEVVTETVRTETRKEDMRMIEDTKKWVLSPERKAPQPTREYAALLTRQKKWGREKAFFKDGVLETGSRALVGRKSLTKEKERMVRLWPPHIIIYIWMPGRSCAKLEWRRPSWRHGSCCATHRKRRATNSSGIEISMCPTMWSAAFGSSWTDVWRENRWPTSSGSGSSTV